MSKQDHINPTLDNSHEFLMVRGSSGNLDIIMHVPYLVGRCEKQHFWDEKHGDFFGICALTPHQARELAAHLVKHADHAERTNEGDVKR